MEHNLQYSPVVNKEDSQQEQSYIKKALAQSKILIVDDAEFNRSFIEQIFRNHGFTHFEYAEDGIEAVEKTLVFKPDLVLLDLVMPKSDGFEYCETIRQHAAFKELAILVQSAISVPDQIAKAFAVGATDYVVKPIHAEELVARSVVHLEKQILVKKLRAYIDQVDQELLSARKMQMEVIPGEDVIEDIVRRYQVSIDAHFQPSSQIGGDLWGVKPISDTEFSMCIIDFSGHGVSSALNTFRLHTLLAELQQASHIVPGELLTHLNAALCKLVSPETFATAFYGVVDIKRNVLSFAAAGAPVPLLLKRSTAEVTHIDSSGVPLGVAEGLVYETREMPFEKDDVLLCYSDALTEAHNAKEECLTESDLQQLLLDNSTAKGGAIMRTLLDAFYEHGGTDQVSDDLTITIYSRS